MSPEKYAAITEEHTPSRAVNESDATADHDMLGAWGGGYRSSEANRRSGAHETRTASEPASASKPATAESATGESSAHLCLG